METMTVQELINELMKIEDKSKEIVVGALKSDGYYDYQGVDRIENYEGDVTIFLK